MKLKSFIRQNRKKRPKTSAKIRARWDIKILGSVNRFVTSILDDVNPRLTALARDGEHIIDGPSIEEKVMELLRKARKLK